MKVLVVYLKTSPSAVLGHNANIGRVDAGSDECVKIVVPQIPHLVFVGERGSSKKVKGIFNRKQTYIGTHTKGQVGIEKDPFHHAYIYWMGIKKIWKIIYGIGRLQP